jgi:hypothetical protein
VKFGRLVAVSMLTTGLLVSTAGVASAEHLPEPGEPNCHGQWVANAAQYWKDIGGFEPGFSAVARAGGSGTPAELHKLIKTFDCV